MCRLLAIWCLLGSCFGDPAPARPIVSAAPSGSAAQPTRSKLDEARDLSEFDDPWLALDPAEAKMIEYVRTMCACRDRICADRIQADMNQWSETNRLIVEEGRKSRATPIASPSPPPRTGSASEPAPDEYQPPPEMMKRMRRIGDKYGTCYGAAKAVSNQR
jgi:hypothetical protein